MRILTRLGLLALVSFGANLSPALGAEPTAVVTRGLRTVEYSTATGTSPLELEVDSFGRLILSGASMRCILAADQVQAFVAAVVKAAMWVERTKFANFQFERSVAEFPGAGPRAGSLGLVVRHDAEKGVTVLRLTLRSGNPDSAATTMDFDHYPLASLCEVLATTTEAIRLAREDATKADSWIDGTAPTPEPVGPNFAIPVETQAPKAAGSIREGADGWHTPKAGYPFDARKRRITGTGAIRVSTDASGRVVRAQMIQSIHALIDSTVESHARTAWKGPPNATKTVPVTYSLND